MKVIIAGSRTIHFMQLILDAIKESGFDIAEVVSGCAPGVDTLGEWWASQNRKTITRFPADWHTHGKAAGPIRNRQMAGYADALIAVWDGKSKGTRHMIKTARELGLQVYVHRFEQNP